MTAKALQVAVLDDYQEAARDFRLWRLLVLALYRSERQADALADAR